MFKKSGFTLIELVLVLLILSIVMGIVAPSLSNFLNGRKSTNAINQLVALARHARAEAISEGKPYRLNVDSTSGEYWINAQDGVDFSDVKTEHGQRGKLPDELKARWSADVNAPIYPVNTTNAQSSSTTGLGGGGAGPQSAGMTAGAGSRGLTPGNAGGAASGPSGQGAPSTYVTFYPDGRTDTILLTLDDGSGNKIELGAYSESETWGVLREEDR